VATYSKGRLTIPTTTGLNGLIHGLILVLCGLRKDAALK